MLSYRLTAGSQQVVISLDATDPNDAVPLQFTGDDGTIATWLAMQYGAFGHLISSATSPIDLDYALSTKKAQQFQPVLLEGEKMVEIYDPKLPDGAIT